MEYAPLVGKKLSPYIMHYSDVILQRKFRVGGRECLIKICAENQDFSDIALGLLYARTTRDLEIMVVTAWAIWYNRNQCVHESEKQSAGQIWDFTLSLLLNYKEASKLFQLGLAFCEVSWKKPPMGVYKIKCAFVWTF